MKHSNLGDKTKSAITVQAKMSPTETIHTQLSDIDNTLKVKLIIVRHKHLKRLRKLFSFYK